MSRIDRRRPSLATQIVLAGSLAAITWPSLAAAQLRTERRVAGDTTIVRTIGVEPPSATRRLVKELTFGKLDGPAEYVFGRITGIRAGLDGSIFVFDQSIPLLRQYDTTGMYIRSFGRRGQGPGEYGQVISVAMAPDGKVYVLNLDANRVSVYSPSGAHVTDWRLPPERGFGSSTSIAANLMIDPAGTIQVGASVATLSQTPTDPIPRSITGIVRYRPDGTVRDTLRMPNLGMEPPPVLRAGGRTMGLGYVRGEDWAFSRLGSFVGGRSDRYEIHVVHSSGKVTRIERDIPRVPISQVERDAIRERITRTLRAGDPLWTWNGPEVPRVKPFFSEIRTDVDGRIWVKLHVPGERIADAERAAAAAGGRGRGRAGAPVLTDIPVFREPNIYEVFAPDGRYLGRVELPQFTYVPIINVKGSTLWSGMTDADGAPVVAKFRIEPALPR